MSAIPALQMWTLREMMNTDFAATARAIGDIGYTSVELAGYGNLDADGAAAALRAAGLNVVGMHAVIERLREDLRGVLRDAELFGSLFITCPSYPRDHLQTAAQCEAAGRELDQIGAAVRKAGYRFAFHNHDIEFREVEGHLRIDLMLRAAAPENLEMELDVYWSTDVGVDTVRWLQANGSRVTQVHLKDEKELGASGRVDFQGILATLRKFGAVKSYIIEQEEYSSTPLEGARLSLAAWKTWTKN